MCLFAHRCPEWPAPAATAQTGAPRPITACAQIDHAQRSTVECYSALIAARDASGDHPPARHLASPAGAPAQPKMGSPADRLSASDSTSVDRPGSRPWICHSSSSAHAQRSCAAPHNPALCGCHRCSRCVRWPPSEASFSLASSCSSAVENGLARLFASAGTSGDRPGSRP